MKILRDSEYEKLIDRIEKMETILNKDGIK